MLRKFGIIAVLSLIIAAVAAVPAWAVIERTIDETQAPQGTHLGNRAEFPTCSVTTNPTTNTVTVNCTGTTLGGVGNTNAVTNLEVDATAQILCHNPGNENVVRPHTTDLTESESNLARLARNGQIVIEPINVQVTTTDVEREFTCPNPSWTEEVTELTLNEFTYTLTFAGFDDPY
jgi:hypothetical protein